MHLLNLLPARPEGTPLGVYSTVRKNVVMLQNAFLHPLTHTHTHTHSLTSFSVLMTCYRKGQYLWYARCWTLIRLRHHCALMSKP